MERAGEKLKRVREALKLTFRDVEQASQEIAFRRGSDEFAVALSRLADIENKGTLPTIYRIYTLCAIYRLDFDEVLGWYGVPRELLHSEAVQVRLNETHTLRFSEPAAVSVPQSLEFEIDLTRTTFLSHMIRRWGKMPLSFLNGLDLREHRYGFVGLDDWSMYPVLHPGALLMIDQSRRKIALDGWTNEFDRPIYFLEHRGGYLCGWCSIVGRYLLVQPHPASNLRPQSFEFPTEIDVIGQVTGVAMTLESKKERHARAAATPAKSPNP
jgi:transcriptional regulator with XRE-family HTH domain